MAEVVDPKTGEVTAGLVVPKVIAEAIIAVGKQVKQLGTDERNAHGGYQYVSVDKFYDTIGKMMAEAGLALAIDETHSEVREGAENRDGKRSAWLFVRYNLAFVHESGEVSSPLRRSCALPISGPQAFGAAQSYIEKQFLRQVFKVPTGEKDADETAPSESAPGGRTAQGSTGGGTSTPPAQQRTQRPPQQTVAPSDAAKAEAIKRHREMGAELDNAMTVKDVDDILSCPAWAEMEKHVRAASPAQAESVIEKLKARAAERRALMLAEPDTEGYGDAA